jgi:hypothetical protein
MKSGIAIGALLIAIEYGPLFVPLHLRRELQQENEAER